MSSTVLGTSFLPQQVKFAFVGDETTVGGGDEAMTDEVGTSEECAASVESATVLAVPYLNKFGVDQPLKMF